MLFKQNELNEWNRKIMAVETFSLPGVLIQDIIS